jgi:predicted metal-dependent phosphoesterase TrpH
MKEIGVSFSHLSKKHIIKYLVYKEYVKNMIEAYNMLTYEESKYYCLLKKLSKYEVLDLIKDNGGVSVLAHPSTLYFSDYEIEQEVRGLMSRGLDGIEVRNRSITIEQGKSYEQIANKLGILTTVGSDFHSPENETIGCWVSERLYEEFETRMVLSKRK